GGEGEAQVIEERLAAAESAGKKRRDDTAAGADEIPTAGQLAGRDPQAQGSDGEGVAAQAEDPGAEQAGERDRRQGAHGGTDEQSGVIAEARVALDEHAGVHPDAALRKERRRRSRGLRGSRS